MECGESRGEQTTRVEALSEFPEESLTRLHFKGMGEVEGISRDDVTPQGSYQPLPSPGPGSHGKGGIPREGCLVSKRRQTV